jgi:RNA polymerase II subunit A small phosphatase-like protein
VHSSSKGIPIAREQMNGQPDPQQAYLLGPQRNSERGRKTLVLDLDETLVHSSFKPVENPDITLPVEIDG